MYPNKTLHQSHCEFRVHQTAPHTNTIQALTCTAQLLILIVPPETYWANINTHSLDCQTYSLIFLKIMKTDSLHNMSCMTSETDKHQ